MKNRVSVPESVERLAVTDPVAVGEVHPAKGEFSAGFRHLEPESEFPRGARKQNPRRDDDAF